MTNKKGSITLAAALALILVSVYAWALYRPPAASAPSYTWTSCAITIESTGAAPTKNTTTEACYYLVVGKVMFLKWYFVGGGANGGGGYYKFLIPGSYTADTTVSPANTTVANEIWPNLGTVTGKSGAVNFRGYARLYDSTHFTFAIENFDAPLTYQIMNAGFDGLGSATTIALEMAIPIQ